MASVYIPSDLKRALAQAAIAKGRSQAQLIREALRAAASVDEAPRPRLPLFASRKPRLAEQVDKALKGFGER